MYIGLHVKCPLLLSGFNENWTYAIHFRNVFIYQNFMNISLVGAEFFHVDRGKN